MMNIYQTINAILSEIDPISKESKNQQQGFYYRGVDAVMNAMAPLFAKHKLFIVPEVIDQRREERTTNKGATLIYSVITMRYTFFAEDGTSLSAVVIGEGMDSGDKASNKAMAIAFKYACFQVFCIPTEETAPDPDKEAHTLQPKIQQKSKPENKPTTKYDPVITSNELIDLYAAAGEYGFDAARVDGYIQKRFGCDPDKITAGQGKAVLKKIQGMVSNA